MSDPQTAIIIAIIGIVGPVLSAWMVWILSRNINKAKEESIKASSKLSYAEVREKISSAAHLLLSDLETRVDKLSKALDEKDAQLTIQSERINEQTDQIDHLERTVSKLRDIVNSWGQLLVNGNIITQKEFDEVTAI